jgi:SMI1-KNR4 cell-wall
MTQVLFQRAVNILKGSGFKLLITGGVSEDTVIAVENRLDCKLPISYKEMLREFGILGFRGKMFYGIGINGLEGDSAPNVIFATQDSRSRNEITEKMVEIMSSGYGPTFVLDCGQLDQRGEAPVYEINELGHKHGMKKIADSFGEFLFGEVNMVMDDRTV